MGIPILEEILHVITSLIQWFFQTIPTPLKFVFFLFFILFLGGFISNTFVGSSFACTTTGTLVEFTTVQAGFDYNYNFFGVAKGIKPKYLNYNITDIEHNNFLLDNGKILSSTTRVTEGYGSLSLTCVQDTTESRKFYKGKLLFFGVDILDIKLWLLFMFGAIIVGLGYKYYRVMGV